MKKKIYFVVNPQTKAIEKIYAGRKPCDNYINKKDYELDIYMFSEDSNNYNQANTLFEGMIFPSNLIF